MEGLTTQERIFFERVAGKIREGTNDIVHAMRLVLKDDERIVDTFYDLPKEKRDTIVAIIGKEVYDTILKENGHV
jgi:hypothetical protein